LTGNCGSGTFVFSTTLLLSLVRDFSNFICCNRIERKRSIEPAVTNLDIRRAVPVNPTQSPPSIFALKRQQRREVALHAQTNRITNKYPHGKNKCISRTTGALEHSLTQNVREPLMQCLVTLVQEASCEEQKAFCRLVVPRSVKVSSVLEHAENPLKCLGKLVLTSPRVEQGEDVDADDGIGTWPFSVKVRLPKMNQP
jgi:hypothetical protein